MCKTNRFFCMFLTVNVVLMLMGVTLLQAQVQQEHHRSSESTVQVEEIASLEIQLLFPEFKPGVVYQGNEVRVFNQLNYNMLLDFMVVVVEDGELMAMDDPHLIDSLRLEGKLFHYIDDHGFFEYITGNDRQGVYVKHYVEVNAETVAQGAYGTANRTTSIDVVRSLVDPSSSDIAERTIEVDTPSGQEIHLYLKREKVFHLLNEGEPHPVHSRRSLTQAFPEHSRELRSFLRDYQINFSNGEDMVRLAEYIYSL